MRWPRDSSGAQAFELTSPDIAEGKTIDMKHVYDSMSCTGENISPELHWSDPPPGTKSFAVARARSRCADGRRRLLALARRRYSGRRSRLKRGAGDASGKNLPSGAHHLETDFGDKAYGGPCPPPGKPHRYVFTVYALKTEKLGDAAHGRTAVAGFTINQNALAKASITALFGR